MTEAATWTLILVFFNAPATERIRGYETYAACEKVGRSSVRQCANPQGSSFNACWSIANFTCIPER